MKLLFSLKALGKKRPFINKVEIDLEVGNKMLFRDFLAIIVQQQVQAFNERKEGKTLLEVISEKQITRQLDNGKVSFNYQYNLTQAEEEKAISTVWQAFEDGLIAFFINESQVESLDDIVVLDEQDSIVIIRLTFLSGSIW